MRYFSPISVVLTLLLLASFSGPSYAEEQFGSWSADAMEGNQGAYAATVNDSGALFGQYCYQKLEKCFWLLANDIGCEAGSEYPVLINADSGAYSVQMVCLDSTDKIGRYAFSDFDAIDAFVKKSSRIGIAFPIKSGLFQVNRFDLNGSSRAVSLMRKFVDELIKTNTGTADKTL